MGDNGRNTGDRPPRMSRADEETAAAAWLAENVGLVEGVLGDTPEELPSGDALEVGDADAAQERAQQADTEQQGDSRWG